MSEAIQVTKHGLFGKRIVYQTDLTLSDFEKRLKFSQDDKEASVSHTATPIEYRYPRYSQLHFDIKALVPFERYTVTAAKALGMINWEQDLKMSYMTITISLGFGSYLYFIFFFAFLLLGFFFLGDWSEEPIWVGIGCTILALVGLVSSVGTVHGALNKLDKLINELIL